MSRSTSVFFICYLFEVSDLTKQFLTGHHLLFPDKACNLSLRTSPPGLDDTMRSFQLGEFTRTVLVDTVGFPKHFL